MTLTEIVKNILPKQFLTCNEEAGLSGTEIIASFAFLFSFVCCPPPPPPQVGLLLHPA